MPVGKTALATRLLSGSFPTEYHPTRADSYSKVITVDGLKCTLDILDTAGQEAFSAVPRGLPCREKLIRLL